MNTPFTPRTLRPLLTLSATLLATLPLLSSSTAHADVVDRMGSNSTQSAAPPEVYTAYQASGLRVIRIGFNPRDYWDKTNNVALTAVAEPQIRAAQENGLTPIILFQYYAASHKGQVPLTKDAWYKIGRAYANKFGSVVMEYTAFNEPMGDWNDIEKDGVLDLDPQDYKNALEGLADGVHSVSGSLRVSPHGYRQEEIWSSARTSTNVVLKNRYLAAVVGLFNNGKLATLDIHRYVGPNFPLDMKYGGPSSQNPLLTNNPRFAIQTQFDEAKRIYGITSNIGHGTSEVNVNAEHSTVVYTDAEAKNLFLTILWSSLGVVDNAGKPNNKFTLIFTLLFPDRKSFTLSKTLDPWVPSARGEVLRMVTQQAAGMDFLTSDPRKSGIMTLQSNSKKMWVWQNRQYWSNLWKSGTTSSFTVTGISTAATRLEVYNENGHLTSLSRSLSNQSSVTLTGLPNNCTLMFVANASGNAGTPVDYGLRQLVNRYSGKVLEIESYSTADGVNARQWSAVSGNKKQVWRFQYESDGYYRLFNDYSGKALALDTSGGTAPGANVFQYNTNTDANRLWKVEPVGGGYYRLINKLSGQALALDLNSATNGGYAATANGANVFQYSYTGNLDNKQWRFDVPSTSSSGASSLQAPASGGSG